eukprot:2310779-Amphidinium_carterae.1
MSPFLLPSQQSPSAISRLAKGLFYVRSPYDAALTKQKAIDATACQAKLPLGRIPKSDWKNMNASSKSSSIYTYQCNLTA